MKEITKKIKLQESDTSLNTPFSEKVSKLIPYAFKIEVVLVSIWLFLCLMGYSSGEEAPEAMLFFIMFSLIFAWVPFAIASLFGLIFLLLSFSKKALHFFLLNLVLVLISIAILVAVYQDPWI